MLRLRREEGIRMAVQDRHRGRSVPALDAVSRIHTGAFQIFALVITCGCLWWRLFHFCLDTKVEQKIKPARLTPVGRGCIKNPKN
jgi:hypothetical protein